MSANDYIQYGIVALIFIAALVWIVRRSKNSKSSSCNCNCSKCSITDKCDKNETKGK
jgi:hypothetical protein